MTIKERQGLKDRKLVKTFIKKLVDIPVVKGQRQKPIKLFDHNINADAFEERRGDLDKEAEWMMGFIPTENNWKKLEKEMEGSSSSDSQEMICGQRPLTNVVFESDSSDHKSSNLKKKQKKKDQKFVGEMTEAMHKRYLKEIAADRSIKLKACKPARRSQKIILKSNVVLETELMKVDKVMKKNLRKRRSEPDDIDEADNILGIIL